MVHGLEGKFGVVSDPSGAREVCVPAVAAVREPNLAAGSPLAQKTFSKWWGLAFATETLAAVPKHQTDEHLLPKHYPTSPLVMASPFLSLAEKDA